MGAKRLLGAAVVAVAIGVPVASAASQAPALAPTIRPMVSKSLIFTNETITAFDGTKLACVFVKPTGTMPVGGWPGVIVFHGLGQTAAQTETPFMTPLATYGFAALACDARGTNGMSSSGGSGGKFGLDGPNDVKDAQTLYNWMSARPDVSNTQIGAFGVSLGGGAVWNATAAGVPFKAIVPTITWTNLANGLNPDNVPKTGYLTLLSFDIPISRWDPSILPTANALLSGTVNSTVLATEAARSTNTKLHSITVPTLLIQGRHDFLFDIDQAAIAYKLLAGPKRLYIGDIGHWPGTTKNPPDGSHFFGEVIAWFKHYLSNGPPVPGGIELAHDPFNGSTDYATWPATHQVTVSLAGSKTLNTTKGTTVRVATPPGEPLQTFSATLPSQLIVSYSGASHWSHLVATVTVAGSSTPLTEGAVPITAASGTATIPLMDESEVIPAGKQLDVTLGAISNDNPYGLGFGPTFNTPEANGAAITLGNATLKLAVLNTVVG